MDSSLPHTLSSQDLLTPEGGPADITTTSGPTSTDQGPTNSTQPPQSQGDQPPSGASAQNADQPTTPVKRKVGRPKGSTNKPQPADAKTNNGQKRPVGRPRKDGLPAGSVKTPPVKSGPGPGRPRKNPSSKSVAPSGSGSAQTPATTSYAGVQTAPTFHPYYPTVAPNGTTQYQSTFPSAPQTSVSAPLIRSSSRIKNASNLPLFQIDPSLEREDWGELARNKPVAFIQTLVVSLAAPNPVSTAGPSVEEAFKSHLVSLAPTPAQKDQIPSLYSILKTFWLPSSPAYFSLTASTSTARTPSEHRFLYWDPQPLVFNGIACPGCSSSLINKGRIQSGPMKVYDLEKPFFIVGCEYVCQSPSCIAQTSPEGRKFASTDSSILRSLPGKLRDEFPAYLMQGEGDLGSAPAIWNWQATGVSRPLWNMVRGCLKSGMTKEAIVTLVRSIQVGVSDDGDEAMEEEEDESDAPHEPEVASPANAAPTAQSATPVKAPETSKKTAVVEPSKITWKAYNGATATSSASTPGGAQAGPSNIAPAPPQPIAMNQTPGLQPFLHQQYGFGQTTPYPTYPYQPYPYFMQPGQQPQPQPQASPDPQSVSNGGAGPSDQSLKRPFGYPDGTGGGEVSILEPSQKRLRHCCKCGSQECKGKGGRSFCLNACQDCGKLDCKGRNSRRPDKRCAEAWS